MSTIKKYVTTKIWPSTLTKVRLLALQRNQSMCKTLDDIVEKEMGVDDGK